MAGGSPAGGLHIEFEERGALIQVNIWGLSSAEVEELVEGVDVVSKEEWKTRAG